MRHLKRIFFCCTLLLGASSLSAFDALIELKGAYFYPMNHKFREIYATGVGLYGLEFTCQATKDLYVWASADIFHKKGQSLGIHYPTKITVVPLGLGLKYLFPISFADLYLGAGILGTYMHIRDYDPFVVCTTPKWGIGGIAKIGTIFNVNSHLFFDLFTNYSYTKIDIGSRAGVITHDADLSGFSFGGAIGYRFGYCKPRNQCCDPTPRQSPPPKSCRSLLRR